MFSIMLPVFFFVHFFEELIKHSLEEYLKQFQHSKKPFWKFLQEIPERICQAIVEGNLEEIYKKIFVGFLKSF